MVKQFADLHVHTTASDGMHSSSEVVRMAQRAGLAAVGITDHDTMEGVAEAMLAAQAAEVEVVPGVEISAHLDAVEIHILGYYPRSDSGPLVALLNKMRSNRKQRVKEMFNMLEELGLSVPTQTKDRIGLLTSPGRPHVGRALVELGYVQNLKEAFSLYIDEGRPAYIPRLKVSACDAIKVVRRSGGVAVFAHPGRTGGLEALPELMGCGLNGIEVHHPDHDASFSNMLEDLAQEHGLLVTGGSDFHTKSSVSGAHVGEVSVPYDVVRLLKAAKG